MPLHPYHRYIWLAETIYHARRITYAEINRKWMNSRLSEGVPLPLRTFHNRRKAIEEIFDINILCDSHTNEYYIENGEDLRRGSLTRWLLESFATANIVRECQCIQERIQLEEIPSAQCYLQDILEAMRNNRAIYMEYQSFSEKQSQRLILLPYFVKLHNRRWYVFGPTPQNQTVKVYALDRIQSLQITDQSFEIPRGFSPEAHLANSLGITRYEDIPPKEITIKAFYPQYLRALPLHHSQQEIEATEEYSLFRYWISPTPDFFQAILSFREYVEILSPEEVRQQWLGIIERMAAFGNKNRVKKR